jgi:hypothetical protein
VTGWIVDPSEGYAWPFVLVAFVSVIGMLAWGLQIPRIEPIRRPDELAPHAPGMQRLR